MLRLPIGEIKLLLTYLCQIIVFDRYLASGENLSFSVVTIHGHYTPVV